MVTAPLKNDGDKIYISPTEAKNELLRRKKSNNFREIVEIIKSELWKNNQPPLPAINGGITKAYLWRNIASVRLEDIEFDQIACLSGFTPHWLEYQCDRFSSRNQTKIDLVRMFLHSGDGKNGGPKLEKIKLLNPEEWENKYFQEMITREGEPLVEFHHRIRKSVFPTPKAEMITDISSWIQSQGSQSKDNYPAFLAMFILNGILFEDFDSPFSGKKEAALQLNRFKESVFLPAFRKVIEITGEEPLIVKLPSKESLSWYPAMLKDKIKFCPLGY